MEVTLYLRAITSVTTAGEDLCLLVEMDRYEAATLIDTLNKLLATTKDEESS